MSHKKWDFTVTCGECGLTEKSQTRNVYRCNFCGSLDVDVQFDEDELIQSLEYRKLKKEDE
jgi:Zn finger protein HypA/HybF involved in hydrogenase expression